MNKNKIFFLVLCSILAYNSPSRAQQEQATLLQEQATLQQKPTTHAASIVYNNQAPKHEVRAVWLTTIGGIDWPHSYAQSEKSAEKQKQELRNILDRLQKININTILIQTRVRGTMIYPSQIEPWDGCLSGFPGKGPGYDALQFAIDECHKRGMELHAWIVTIPVGKWDKLGCKRLRQRYPSLIRKIGTDGYMNPEDSRTGDYLARICREVTHNYDVDGIHLDYIRYPETWNIKVSREQGRRYITNIVKKIHDAVKSEKPWVKMSCSPIGKFDDLSRYWSHGWNAYTKVCQDAQGWLKDGLMDELFPMMYFRNEQFYPFAIDWQEQSQGKIVVPGLGIYFLDPKEGKWSIGDITAEMQHTRNLGMGYAFFRNKFLLDNRQGILDFTEQFNPYPALVPPMTWASKRQPTSPQQLQVNRNGEILTFSWKNNGRYTDGSKVPTPYIYNNVYASRTYPVDTNDARNLVAARYLGTQIALPNDMDSDDSPLYFAVTAMDGYGIESQVAQEDKGEFIGGHQKYGAAKMLLCDGNIIKLGDMGKKLDTKVLVVETLQGVVLGKFYIIDNSVNISRLKPGTYRLASLNHRGIRHLLGTFSKKNFNKN